MRLKSLERRLADLQETVRALVMALERAGSVSLAEASIRQWVTDFVSMRLPR